MITRSHAMIATIAACAILLALPAAAVDGEILIDQAKVNAGGITPGDAPGFPATLSRPGRYKLSGNLRVPAGPIIGIEVTQHDVTIDLNGFTISTNPPDQPAFAGVLASNVNGLRVMNGTIVGFGAGVQSHPGRGAVVEDMRLVSNDVGIVVETEARIRNNTIANGRSGIGVASFDIFSISWTLIEQNLVAGNTFNAIDVQEPFGALESGALLLLGNVIVGNGGWTVQGFGNPVISYGNNVLLRDGDHFTGVTVVQLHPNVCEPAC